MAATQGLQCGFQLVQRSQTQAGLGPGHPEQSQPQYQQVERQLARKALRRRFQCRGFASHRQTPSAAGRASRGLKAHVARKCHERLSGWAVHEVALQTSVGRICYRQVERCIPQRT